MGRAIGRQLHEAVRRRAAGLCEYCGYPEHACYATFHCDHCVPHSASGATVLANLAWACPTCNAAKAHRTLALDPLARKLAPLFNPRQQSWDDHFPWSPDWLHIVGKTPTGRATVECVRMNRTAARRIRLLLVTLGLHPAQP